LEGVGKDWHLLGGTEENRKSIVFISVINYLRNKFDALIM
jgi:hypothetical protein